MKMCAIAMITSCACWLVMQMLGTGNAEERSLLSTSNVSLDNWIDDLQEDINKSRRKRKAPPTYHLKTKLPILMGIGYSVFSKQEEIMEVQPMND